MDEKQLQAKIIKELKKIPNLHLIKIITANTSGEPDLIMCYKSRFIGMEVKTKENKPTDLQLKKLKDIRDSGGKAFIVRSIDDALNIIATSHQKMPTTINIEAREFFKEYVTDTLLQLRTKLTKRIENETKHK